jgi:hypothetical protein
VKPLGLTSDFLRFAAEIVAGRRVECSWAAFRVVYFPGMDDLNRLLASIAEGILDEGIIYDCPWDDFRFVYFRKKNSETAAREASRLGAAAGNQGGV